MKKRGNDDFPFDDLAGPRKSIWNDPNEQPEMNSDNTGSRQPGGYFPASGQAPFQPDQFNAQQPPVQRSQPDPYLQQRPKPSADMQRRPQPSASMQQPLGSDGYKHPRESRDMNRSNMERTSPAHEYALPNPRPRTLNRQIQILSVIAAVLLIIVFILGYFTFFGDRKPSGSSAATTAAASVTAAVQGTSAASSAVVSATPSPAVSATPVSPVSNDPNSLANLPPSNEHPVIALTFDDGPSASLTPKLLDTLKEKGVHATFFVLGQETLDSDPALLKRMIDEGHEIGNHSYDHSIYTELTADQIRDQLTKTNDAVFAATGAYPTVMRPPTGGCNDTVLAISTEMNLPVVNWSWQSCPEDWLKEHQTPEFISQHVIDNAANGHIVLLHDIHTATVDSVAAMIDGLIAKGYRFATVSEILSAQPNGEKTGVLYYNATFA